MPIHLSKFRFVLYLNLTNIIYVSLLLSIFKFLWLNNYVWIVLSSCKLILYRCGFFLIAAWPIKLSLSSRLCFINFYLILVCNNRLCFLNIIISLSSVIISILIGLKIVSSLLKLIIICCYFSCSNKICSMFVIVSLNLLFFDFL